MTIPAPVANHRAACALARKWLARIGYDHVDDFGRGVVPMRVHTGCDRLVRWAESRVPARSRARRRS